ncbi:hydrolase [Nocardiopsis gilva YIM 90087]|uniref:Hydrolase n=1 Tax=Nocardiopsis gilva YIM 90087 TaxID=1235441 RepID=A0A223S0A2_9ACTN|nr:HAD-IB family phosphatase [Nocardiopsis gilva]ASU81563.1 hydrolase [Nocardiopsis gilva YIM 90087]
MSYLHVFDMDGTLLKGTSASLQIARATGTEAELRDLERAFASGEIDTRAFAAALPEVWPMLTDDHVAGVFRSGPFLDGIADVCGDIRSRGERSMVITMSPDFYAERLFDFGFDEVVASRFPALPFTEPPLPENILTPADKPRIVEEARRHAGIARERCVAYGDSMSDAALFRHLAHSVAVNADHHLADIAGAHYSGGSLVDAYAEGRALLRPCR